MNRLQRLEKKLGEFEAKVKAMPSPWLYSMLAKTKDAIEKERKKAKGTQLSLTGKKK